MSESSLANRPLSEFLLFEKTRDKRIPLIFDLEITARCPNNCRHCYINLPAGDAAARGRELTLPEVERIAEEAVSLGALWCLITGGEPLLREDFPDIYLCLKKKGLLVSVFTSATAVTAAHASLFRKYPPRDLEITVYGATPETYEKVTRRPGSFAAFRRGLDLLSRAGLPVRLKAAALRSNAHEMTEIARFCRELTRDYFRFDPFLTLRHDRDPGRNREILAERLPLDEILRLERADPERMGSLERNCDKLLLPEDQGTGCRHIFRCGAGVKGFTLGWEGDFRLCSSLTQSDCVYDLREGSLAEAWERFVPRVLAMQSNREEYLAECGPCRLVNLCMWCPANAWLECGELDRPVESFCRMAHGREEKLFRKNGP